MSILSNVLLITVDDLNYDSVGCFGCQVDDITPNIDKLASEGVRFNNSHVTIAVCQPSRSVLLTGRYPHHNGARGFEEIDASVTTLTQVLHREGFLNGIIGKEDHVAPKEKFFWDEYVQTYCEEEGWGRSPEVYYDKVKQFLTRAREEGKPFFLMANSHDPHRPYVGADDEMFYFGHHPTADRIYTPEEITVPGCLPDLPDVRKELAQYFSSVHRGDQIVGKILQALDDMGYRDDTLVLFLSDNGMALPYAKTNCYLNSTKSPYIMRWPGRIPAGSVSDALVSGIDFTPTVLDVLGIEPIVDADGRSMKHMIMEGAEQYDDIFTLFFKTNNNHITHRALHFPMRCVQNKRFCNGIFNHTSLCEFNQGKLLLHLTIPFEKKPKTNLPSDNLKYYRQRKQMTTRQLAEKLDIVPATVVLYESGKHPIPYDVAIKLADVLKIEAALFYDDFSRFLAVPYTEALKSVRMALGLSQKAFAEQIEVIPSYYYKLEEGNRRPSRKVYQKICAVLEATGRQTSLLWEQPLQ
mgnify:FL=1